MKRAYILSISIGVILILLYFSTVIVDASSRQAYKSLSEGLPLASNES
jgi:hypothetical protein